jgi:leader peptidase (prepilin peptidase)/N-methyltransferase
MAVGFLVISYQLSVINQVVVVCLIFWVTTIIAVMDFETKLVADMMVIIWGILVFCLNLPLSPSLVKEGVTGVMASVGLIGGIWLVSKGKAMGSGDIGIAAVMGWWLGWPNIAVGLWVAFVSGAIYGVIKLIKRSSKLRDEVAFGPWLVIGSWIGFLYGEKLIKMVIK